MVRRISGWQLSCSLLELLGLMMWIGSLTALLTMVIPAVFNTLEMETGGRFLRRVFDGYNAVTVGVVVVLIGTASFRHWKHRQAPNESLPVSRSEVGLLMALTFVTVLIVAVLGPKAVALQEIAFEADSQEAKKAALEAFFRMHMIVRALHLINAGLAISLLTVKFRHWVRNRGAFGFE
ncbi:MAG: DUF4149 domain-containing protein [Nitrospira sp.]|nr:DUF4149 domain-containing protein [Nitrospira sp.]